MNRALALLCAAALFAGCHKAKTASPAFAEASDEFNHLYAQELDQAFLDPQMDSVEAKLKTVPKDSLDFDAAQSLLERIEEGRKEALRQQKEQSAAQAEAATPPSFPEDETPPPAPDAGSGQPVAGMSREDFTKNFSSCFSSQGPVQIADGGSAEIFSLASSDDCQKEFPWYAERFVVLDQDKIVGFALKSSLQHPAVAPDAGRP